MNATNSSGLLASIDTDSYVDEGKIIATNLIDGWYLFVSDYDGKTYYVNPEVVTFDQVVLITKQTNPQ